MLLLTPRTTEKAYGLSASTNTYVFDVPMEATKQQIAATVAAEFNVAVVSVKTVVQKGKSVRFSRGKNRYPGTTTRRDAKKAYVTLAENNTIPVFDQTAGQESN